MTTSNTNTSKSTSTSKSKSITNPFNAESSVLIINIHPSITDLQLRTHLERIADVITLRHHKPITRVSTTTTAVGGNQSQQQPYNVTAEFHNRQNAIQVVRVLNNSTL